MIFSRNFLRKVCVVPLAVLALAGLSLGAAAKSSKSNQSKQNKPPELTPLDRYIQEALRGSGSLVPPAPTPGSIWAPGARLSDLGRDLRATQIDDLVTVLVEEHASAASTGVTKTQRQSSTTNSITTLAGVTRAAGPWANLANVSGNTQLNGQGQTSRQTDLTLTLAARVTHVLPNGYLVVEGAKDVQINSERQTVIVRGVVRPADLSPNNVVPSTSLAQLEVRINGKGVVNDAVRRPNILYRILLGLLPF